MENNPLELPKEWKDKIQVAAKFQASLQFHIKYSPDQHTACMITYTQGAMAYARWLYTCQMNYAALKERCDKMEAALKDIGRQNKTNESEEEGDIEYGYDCIIDVAREALAGKEREKEVGGD